MVKQVSAKNTKEQILEAYEQLIEEHHQLQTKYDQLLAEKETLGKKLSRPEAVTTAAEGKPAAKVAAAERIRTVGDILAGLATVQGGFGSALSELSIQLTAEVARLQEMRQQAAARAEQLEKLYGLTIAQDTLDRLLEEYEEKAQAFQERARQSREALENEMAEKRAAWQKEQEEHARTAKEQREQLKRERQRSEAEYTYQLELSRKLALEQYEQQQKKLHRELEELAAAKEREWKEREAAIAASEQEYKDLKTRVETFPRELEAAVKRAEKEGIEAARRQAKVRYDLMAKEEEGDRRVAELQIQALEETIQRQTAQIESLSAHLDSMVRQGQELAIKAIEGTAHETSFQSIREIALEQAKNVPKLK